MLKARCVNDSLLVLRCHCDQVTKIIAGLETAFAEMHTYLSFTFVHKAYHLLRNKKVIPQPCPFLEIDLLPDHIFTIEHTVNVKDSSLYFMTPYSSLLPDAAKRARITTARHRLITLSSTTLRVLRGVVTRLSEHTQVYQSRLSRSSCHGSGRRTPMEEEEYNHSRNGEDNN